MSPTFHVLVRSITLEAAGVLSFELRPLDGQLLPAFTAGAHIDLHLPGGLVRSYSLLNSQDERHRYVVAVQLDANGRGGSRAAHELRVGQTMGIAGPRNNFQLAEAAPHTVLVAGGIGITPLWCMVQRLQTLGRSWELHYCARTRQQAALLDRVEALAPTARARVHLNFDHEPGASALDLAGLQSRHASETHFYCCGPTGMIQAFQAATAQRRRECVHVEYFANPNEAAVAGGFAVQLARRKVRLLVAPGRSILQTLLDAGVEVPYSCMEGVCGSCEVPVLAGEPEHRDLVLSPEEQARNTRIMVCCSGSRSDTLVLDL
ncbi:PDR/VanB family oxidoreductase [Hydrogenophaga sp.]|jgi:vanillate O-demethylase ferredoxin subunit|uniref:PDR/VanB family oxidoreductase n=1 Tax=Hydrogenophaga sp. TaxID=1904254 RepID=UPI003F6F94D7